eukprot:TRINITY_DN5831_c0_g1_i1.p1 TRINITY_DN5831_c0_g1~~TRINITY_DN5831_c0_g1_i1.p1  ORF type:complete len:458 (-),score=75.89 TRINITY_DN5831_c0_g1_i1:34-1407(-)
MIVSDSTKLPLALASPTQAMLPKWKGTSEDSWLRTKVNVRTTVEASLDVRKEDTLQHVATTTRVNFFKTPLHHLKANCEVAADEGNLSYTNTLSYSRTLTPLHKLRVQAQVGASRRQVEVGLGQQWRDLKFRETLCYNNQSTYPSLNLFSQVGLSLPLIQKRVRLSLGTILGSDSHLKAQMSRDCKTNAWSVSAETNSLANYSGTAFVRQFLDRRTWISLATTCNNVFEWALKFSMGFLVNRFTSLELGVDVQLAGLDLVVAVNHWGHRFRFPISVPVYLSVASVLAYIFGASATSLFLNYLVVRPYQRSIEEAAKEDQLEKLEGQREIALAFRDHLRKMDRPSDPRLNILCASYGNLASRNSFEGPVSAKVVDKHAVPSANFSDSTAILNVTEPLQYCITNSKLILGTAPKHSLLGFYDPVTSLPNYLEVYYELDGACYCVVVEEEQPLVIQSEVL